MRQNQGAARWRYREGVLVVAGCALALADLTKREIASALGED